MEYIKDIENNTNFIIQNKTPFYNSWTDEGKIRIIEWIKEAKLLSNCHNDSAIYFNKLNRNFIITNIVSGALATCSSFYTVASTAINVNETETNDFYSISCTTLFSLVTVITSSILFTFNWDNRYRNHNIMTSEYTSILKNLECQLAISIDNREDIILLLTKTSDKFKEIGFRAPIIPNWIRKKNFKPYI